MMKSIEQFLCRRSSRIGTLADLRLAVRDVRFLSKQMYAEQTGLASCPTTVLQKISTDWEVLQMESTGTPVGFCGFLCRLRVLASVLAIWSRSRTDKERAETLSDAGVVATGKQTNKS